MRIVTYYRGDTAPKPWGGLRVNSSYHDDSTSRDAYHALFTDAFAGRVDYILANTIADFENFEDVMKLDGIGIRIIIPDEGLDTSTSMGRILLEAWGKRPFPPIIR